MIPYHIPFSIDYFCADKQEDKLIETTFDYSFIHNVRIVSRPLPDPTPSGHVFQGGHVGNHEVVGNLDRGTPLMVKENERWTVAGILTHTPRFEKFQTSRPLYFSKIYPEAFNWIVKNADSTQDSGSSASSDSCETYTSCSCGIVGQSNRYQLTTAF